MKKILLLFLLLSTIHIHAQIKMVTIQASGLTCSLCSNAIFKSLKTVDYIDEVKVDIKQSSFNIYFKPSASVDFDQLKSKVEKAGFFVANFDVVLNFDQLIISENTHKEMNGLLFHFLHTPEGKLNGEKTIRVIDKGYVTNKEFKKFGSYTTMHCFKTGYTESCCNKIGFTSGKRIYHVTII